MRAMRLLGLGLVASAAAALRAPRIVVVGGGFGGVYTALKLASYPWASSRKPQITVIDPKDRFVFLPLLYDYAVGDAGEAEVCPTFRSLFKRSNIEALQGQVDEVFTESRSVTLQGSDEVLEYDALVLSPGAEANLGVAPGASEFALPFHVLDDAIALRGILEEARKSAQRMRTVVVGGGYAGVELACSLAERRGAEAMDVTLVGSVLTGAPEGNRKAAEASLTDANVKVIAGVKVTEIRCPSVPEGVEPTEASRFEEKRLTLGGGEDEITADLVFWTAGTRPSGVLSRIQGVEVGERQRIEVDEMLRVPGTSGRIFCLGDAAVARSAGQEVPASAQVVFQEADYVAYNVWSTLATPPRRAPQLLAFRYVGLGEMLTLGTPAKASVATPFGIDFQGPLAGVARRLIYIVRMPTVGSIAGSGWGFGSKLVGRAFRRTTPKKLQK